jgi:hypothetical protein
VYSFVPIPGAQQHKRPRRRYEEIERMYKCGWNGCEKAYGTLNHLNAHVTMQSHGSKRTPEGEFSLISGILSHLCFMHKLLMHLCVQSLCSRYLTTVGAIGWVAAKAAAASLVLQRLALDPFSKRRNFRAPQNGLLT